jgi:AcrR family transcriptional regulator
MAEQGYPAIAARDIAARARVNRSTFYRHFEDKDDLFNQGCSSLFDSIFRRMRAPLAEDAESGRMWTPEYFTRLFMLIDGESDTLTVIGGPGGNPEFRRIMREKIDAFIIEERLRPFATGIVEPDSAELYAAALSSIVTGLATKWLGSPERFSLEKVCGVYRDAITRGIPPYSRALPR